MSDTPHREPTSTEATAVWRAREIVEHRGLGVVPNHGGGWSVRDAEGRQEGTESYPDPVAAALAVEQLLATREQAQEERAARELLQALNAGLWYPRPRSVDTDDPEAPTATVWDVVDAAGKATAIAGVPSAHEAIARARTELLLGSTTQLENGGRR